MTSESNDKELSSHIVRKNASAGNASSLIRTIAPAPAPATPGPNHLDLAAIRERLDASKGPDYWRSLDEIAGTEGFQDFLHREFPRQASEWEDVEGRRNFLKLMGASLALAGLGACTRQPTETIMPYVNQPELVIPGRPLYYASAFTVSGVARGILVESHMGRPTKIEGNPEHPASLGSTDATTQASVLGLYDPDRSQTVTYLHEIRTYASFLAQFTEQLKQQEQKQGAGIRILTETLTSPTLGAQLNAIQQRFPAAKWIQYEPLGSDNVRAGAKLAFGEYANPVYKLETADVLVSLDADLFGTMQGGVRYARDYADRRRGTSKNVAFNRFYAVETTPTHSGAKADHRLPIKPSQMEDFARSLAAAVGVTGATSTSNPIETKWFNALVKDLQEHKGSSLVVAGDNQSPEVQALVHAINATLDNAGKTVIYTDPIEVNPTDQLADFKSLMADLDAGIVDILLIIGVNPFYDAPADLDFPNKYQKAALRVHVGSHQDETAQYCQWHVPLSHPLEMWGDARAYDGTVSLIQPLISPLYQSRSAYEILAAFNPPLTDKSPADQPGPDQSGYDMIRKYWMAQKPSGDFEAWWRKTIHDGLIAGSALPAKNLAVRGVPSPSSSRGAEGMEISFHADPYRYDGQFANNSWLQELPNPMTRLTWDNAVLVSTATAQKLDLQPEDRVELKCQGRTVEGAVWIQPGQPNDSIAVCLGFGRTHSGRSGNGAGFNAYRIRTSNNLTWGSGLALRKLNEKFKLASVQGHFMIDAQMLNDRGVVRSGTVAEYQKDPGFARKMTDQPGTGDTVYPETWKYEGYAWGMTIDQNACTGCNACVVACQSENNIAVVGKEQVLKTREMHWIRIDRYYKGNADAPETYFQPVPCMQCEDAPCELVCPVAATEHDQDGLNNMVYNRCVGTRYCSNNCPYKVRRFNFLLFTDWETESVKLQRNPDVSVRSRGVMEKCTYCIQRISYAKINAEREDRKITDGEITTACEAACPARAITFGDINDPNSRVTKAKKEQLNYSLLSELNTRPRTSYLAELRNPNPEIEG
jgi:MoCo/4Fe-4S cofactor protein with predicted Tat translocation signal